MVVSRDNIRANLVIDGIIIEYVEKLKYLGRATDLAQARN